MNLVKLASWWANVVFHFCTALNTAQGVKLGENYTCLKSQNAITNINSVTPDLKAETKLHVTSNKNVFNT